jgi:hypothetical protein
MICDTFVTPSFPNVSFGDTSTGSTILMFSGDNGFSSLLNLSEVRNIFQCRRSKRENWLKSNRQIGAPSNKVELALILDLMV